MPIKIFSLEQAFANRKSDVSKWPSDKESQSERLSPLAKPAFEARFSVKSDDFIFTVGSCFARNIERQLEVNGFDFAARYFPLQHEESDFRGLDVGGVLNKYVVFSILNELRWALDCKTPYSDDFYVQLRGGKWWDPHLNNTISPSSRERVKHRRKLTEDYFRMVAGSDVFIMTLGLAEAWYDTKTGLYANGTPPATVRLTEPTRFEFHVLDYSQILSALEGIHDLLSEFGKPSVKVLVTVSPVALKSTFSGEDSMVANTYSKSVQRAAVAAYVANHANVAYFPSYESVILSERSLAWESDQLHASDELVRYNVLAMMNAYAEQKTDMIGETGASKADDAANAITIMHQAEALDREGKTETAAQRYEEAVAISPTEGLIHMNHARFLLKHRKFEEAVRAARLSVENGSAAYGGYTVLATSYRTVGRTEDAYTAIDKAIALSPTKIGNLHAKVVICVKLGRYEEACDLCERILKLLLSRSDDINTKKFTQLYVSTANGGGFDSRAAQFLATYAG